MPKTINRKCQQCAFLDIDESRSRDCWVEKACKERRKRYRNRNKINQRQRDNYALATGRTPPQKFDLEPAGVYRVEFILYGKSPSKQGLVNGGVNAVQALIYEGNNPVYESNPLNTQGLLASDLEIIIDQNLEQISEQFNITKVAQFIWKDGFPKR